MMPTVASSPTRVPPRTIALESTLAPEPMAMRPQVKVASSSLETNENIVPLSMRTSSPTSKSSATATKPPMGTSRTTFRPTRAPKRR
eukprot:4043831-Prymnesium_polylepis.1